MPLSRGPARLCALVLAIAACGDVGDRVGAATQGQVTGGWQIPDAIDMNGDGLADLVWSNPDRNRLAIFLLWGTGLLQAGPEIPGPGVGWSAPTAEDFNFDGIGDLPWFDARTHRAAIWLLRDTHVAEPGAPFPAPPGPDWVLGYTGDFNGDGMADLLWHDEVGSRFTIWLMQGTHVIERGPILPTPPGQGWTTPTTGDFNGDGLSDITWYDNDHHRVAIWLMRGTSVLEAGSPMPGPSGPFYPTPSSGDFNHDGMSDLLWNDAAANVMTVWLMRGTHPFEIGPDIPGPPGSGWITATIGDTDGDGLADVIWQGSSPTRFAVWLMAGTHVRVRGPEIRGPR